MEHRLNKIENRVAAIASSGYFVTGRDFATDNADSIRKSVGSLGRNIDIKRIEDKIGGFAESSKVLMNILDDVSKVHPFIGVAVLAFKAVITLELKRRDNDQKVIALKIAMSDMMSVLVQLRHVSNHDTTTESQIGELMEKIAEDIKDCGNLCDTYQKKGLVAKVLKGPIWDTRLADFVSLFETRRKEIGFALSLHTTLGVDAANRTMTDVQKDLNALDAKLDLLVFRRLNSPREKELLALIDAKGGLEACVNDECTLKGLALFDRSEDTPANIPLAAGARVSKPSESAAMDKAWAKLKPQLSEAVDVSLRTNMVVFERKFDVQKRQLLAEMEVVVRREGDRVISAVVSGPHDRIVDSDLHAIWKDMGWRGSVKSRHFVLALQDYFIEKFLEQGNVGGGIYSPLLHIPSEYLHTANDIPPTSEVKANDQWTLAYINIMHVQSLVEAFDDDGAGFVSVKEANRFTGSRPQDWSLAHWLAYWAAGWHCTVWDYRCKIYDLVNKMTDSVDNLLPINRQIVNRYLCEDSINRIKQLLRSVTPYQGTNDADLREKIRPYVLQEEQRIKDNLEAVKYDIDAPNTLALITGPGRIERYIFPLLFLVLQRHWEIIRIARKEILCNDEVDWLVQSVVCIFGAIDERIANLEAIFKQKNLDIEAQLGRFAFGMFQGTPDPDSTTDDEDDCYNTSENDDNGSDDDETVDWGILRFGVEEEAPDLSEYIARDAEDELDAFPLGVEGLWTGPYFYFNQPSTDGLMQFTLHDVNVDQRTFRGEGNDGLDSFSIAGSTRPLGGAIEVKFVKSYNRLLFRGRKTSWLYCGLLDQASGTIEGHWGSESSDTHLGTFRLGRSPAFAYQFRYSKEEFVVSPARARWSFACAAVRHQVRQQLWSWAYFESRATARKRFLELYHRREMTSLWYRPADKLSDEETAELEVIEKSLSPADARFYRSLARLKLRTLCVHANSSCDSCYSAIIDARVICLKCTSKDYSDEINLCIDCLEEPASRLGFTHEPSHDVVKVTRVVHDREKMSLIRVANEVVEQSSSIIWGSSREDVIQNTTGDNSRSVEMVCSCCEYLITDPCWFCTQCESNTIICNDCDESGAECSNEDHDDSHPLVRAGRVRSEAPETEAMEAKLRLLEARLANSTNERLAVLERKVEDRLTALEGLMQLMLSKFTEFSSNLVLS